jgi:hypothetical protein
VNRGTDISVTHAFSMSCIAYGKTLLTGRI